MLKLEQTIKLEKSSSAYFTDALAGLLGYYFTKHFFFIILSLNHHTSVITFLQYIPVPRQESFLDSLFAKTSDIATAIPFPLNLAH